MGSETTERSCADCSENPIDNDECWRFLTDANTCKAFRPKDQSDEQRDDETTD